VTSTRGRHAPDALAGFLSDEGRQAWARRPDGSMFRLDERGGTKELRQRAHDGGLLCPVHERLAPECELVAGPAVSDRYSSP
jgi:hypothetical protein